jgi:hypothetical protein
MASRYALSSNLVEQSNLERHFKDVASPGLFRTELAYEDREERSFVNRSPYKTSGAEASQRIVRKWLYISYRNQNPRMVPSVA